MNRKIKIWLFAGFIFVSLLGTFLHFLYDISGKSLLAALFSGVNESTWEHMKLLYFPMLIFAFIQSRYFKDYGGFWCVKLIGTLVGLIAIPTIFYTYNGAFGKSPDWLNITIFFISAFIGFLVEFLLLKQNRIQCRYKNVAIVSLCLIGVLFFAFTFYPPKIPLFADPISQGFGISA